MTAVEWLIEKLTDEPEHYLFLCDKPEYMYGLTKIIQQAIEMEKQQIIEAHGLIAKLQEDGSHKLISGETYYDETYKSTKK
jgi:hypothetical protein